MRNWVLKFVRWYNTEHQHSAIGFVSQEQRHNGQDDAILQARKRLYEQVKADNPQRWSRHTRNWDKPATVWLNPAQNDRKILKKAA